MPPERPALKQAVVGASEPVDKPHLFWDTQPVPKLDDAIEETENGPLEEATTPDHVRQEPYKLPAGYEWCDCDITDQQQLQEVYKLLEANYVEDDDNMFRFAYSEPFLRWALTPPGFQVLWHIGVRVTTSKKLVAFITGVPATINVRGKQLPISEINFLCVHKKLRSKRLAPVLIKEVTRRVNLMNRWQAVYTAGVMLPKPVAACRYWHRSLNPKKLYEVGFSSLSKRMTTSRAIRLYRVSETPLLSGIREMCESDVDAVTALLREHLRQYSLYPVLDRNDVAHWILPRRDVVCSFVREVDGKVTDLFSFYLLPSSVIGNSKYKILSAAYSFYNVAKTVELRELMMEALIMAKKMGCDVFNALDVMSNESFLKELKFGIGDGYLRYYLYNWKCAEMRNDEVGLVLL